LEFCKNIFYGGKELFLLNNNPESVGLSEEKQHIVTTTILVHI